MKKFGTSCFGIGRLLGIAALLLLTPLTASATGSNANSPMLAASSHSVLGKHQADVSADTIVHHTTPADEPRHCHLTSPQAQEVGPAQATVNDNPPPLSLNDDVTPFGNTRGQSTTVWSGISIQATPRFILFGNFRS